MAWSLIVLPFGLGLLGFIEPCSIGSSLLFLKTLEGKPAHAKIAQALVFTFTRAAFIGSLGILAAFVGTAFAGLQRAGWLGLGLLYAALGVLYLTGHIKHLMVRVGPKLRELSSMSGSLALAVLFGLNIPACAAPLLTALLGTAALGGATAVWQGFVMLALFGLALSLPLALAMLWPLARRKLDRLAGLSERAPILIGLMLVALGAWSIYFGLFVDVVIDTASADLLDEPRIDV